MAKEEFEKVFAETAEKSGVAEMARDYQFAENLQRMMIDLRDKLCPAEQQSNSFDKFIQSLLETYPTNKNEVPTEALNDYHQGLICGARKTYNWILRSAFDGEITKFFDGNLSVIAQLPKDSKCCFGDKVKVIVIKEDK